MSGGHRDSGGQSALTGCDCTRGGLGLLARLATFLALPATVLLTWRVGEGCCSEPHLREVQGIGQKMWESDPGMFDQSTLARVGMDRIMESCVCSFVKGLCMLQQTITKLELLNSVICSDSESNVCLLSGGP